ncbi:MAG: T9SS type A sorting domain-containing protein, partial [Bacteroidota bacterium]
SYEDDADSDVVPNFLDADADNDGLPDNMEAQPTASYTAAGSTDTDGDGILNEYESSFLSPTNTDSNGEADYLDSDSDGDGYLDRDEAWDVYDDGDAINDESCNSDADGDGILNCYDANDGDNTNVTISRIPPNDNGFNGSDYTGSQTSTGTGLATIYPNNGGVLAEPDWRDASGCTVSPQLVYPITGTDNLFNESSGKHEVNPSATGKIRATGYCEDLITAGWNYYYSPLNSDQLIFAINHGANTTPIDYIELRRANVSDRQSTSGSQGYFVLGRDWFVKTIDDAALTANVNVRFYFDPTDSTTFYTEASDFATDEGGVLGSVTWFKVDNSWEGTDINPGTGLNGLAGYTTLTPASYGEESGLHYVQFDNLSSFSGGGAIVPVTGVLPVELLSFQGKQIDREILLNWATATEVNSESFELERFADSNFVKIGEVEAAGISSETITYEFIDRDLPSNRRSLVYRLKQIDIDGSFTYSNSIEVALLENLWNNRIKVFPNPATDQLNITYEAINQGVVNLEVFDLNGRRVIQENQKANSQLNSYYLDISQLEVGFYLLSVEQEGNQQRILFQVQK